MFPAAQLTPPFRISQCTYRSMGSSKLNGPGKVSFFWGLTQAVEMALYLCDELPQQAIFNQVYARGADCEKRTVDLAGFSFHKYPEARKRAYHLLQAAGKPSVRTIKIKKTPLKP